MKRTDFSFHLPEQLIARYPASERRGSRLLCLDGAGGEVSHRQFTDFTDLVEAGDLLVFNNTRVIPARLYGQKDTGGKLEILIERITGDHTALAHVRASKSPRPGTGLLLYLKNGEMSAHAATVVGREGDLFELQFSSREPLLALLDKLGHVPLPPYIDRADEATDLERYQTVYAHRPGAVAAPTAGLHFDDAMLAELESKGVDSAFVTLHVGAGTFQPVRAENIEDHVMHAEWLEVSDEACRKVRRTRAAGGRVIAVGTTSVRCLESASQGGEIRPFCGDTDIFIYPGYRFQSVDGLLTNFHLPESTLLMLVSAFAGREQVLAAYAEAITQGYRFFSYGDAMFILPRPQSLAEPP